MDKSIYLVYTWYITCINLSYDELKYIPDVHLLKTFCNILEPVTLRYGQWPWYIPRINQVETWHIPCPYRNVTGTEKTEKALSRRMPGIYCMSSYERFMHGIYQVYI